MSGTTKRQAGAKAAATIVAIAILILRKLWPDLLDATDLLILALALLPWLSSILKSVEFPGGGKIEFKDVQSAVSKVVVGAPVAVAERAAGYSGEISLSMDPNLALVGLRIEIERRVARLAAKHGLEPERSLLRTIRSLQSTGLVKAATVSGLLDLLMLGNRAAHGAAVDQEAGVWARDYGPQVLAVLDELLEDE
jgi:hypothetical protein